VLLLAVCAAAQDTPPPPPEAPSPQFSENVEVVAVTPIHGLGVPKWKVATNVQVFSAPRLPEVAPGDVAGLLSQRAISVHVTDTQAGTFQPDVLFRGFAGSPLLGSSEGLAVYQDGVRMNEAFGDTVNWDALPSNAVASINVMPGSNPLFGLNTLGGAISIRTKDGFAYPGRQVSLRAGSFGRYDLDAEAGGQRGPFAYYLAGGLTSDNGWRQHSPSDVRRFFGDVAWRGTGSTVHVSFTGASNDLVGNGPAPEQLLSSERDAVFTYPDRTDSDLGMATVKLSSTGAFGQVDALGYYRGSRVRTFNGDVADDEADGEEDDEDGPQFDAINNRSDTRTHAVGMTAQLSRRSATAAGSSDLIVGVGLDSARTSFDFGSEWATLTEDRGTIGSGEFDDAAAVDLRSRAITASVFATNIWSPAARLGISLSARLNWTDVALRDQLGEALNGDHTFLRLNPAAGVTYQLTPRLNIYGSYTQSSRVPTPVELTCADPEDPCRLPNAFVSDPPLDQIVAATWEAGARGASAGLSWSLSAYHTAANDDIIFVSSGTLRGEGHFENVDRTIRRGIEAGVTYARGQRLSMFAAYTRQRATFATPLRVASRFHPAAEGFEIGVDAGDQLPGVPVHHLKLGIAGPLTSRLHAGVDVRAQSGQFLRGDEANLAPRLSGFVVTDAHARHRIGRRVSIVAQVHNLFDRRFHTFGILGDASLLGPAFDRGRFYSPGAPRAFSLAADLNF
jgi:iron complex outermembrane recepter protein